jgi:hypothetical protein
MKSGIKKCFYFFLLLLVFFPGRVVSADVGPKPTLDFIFEQEVSGSAITIISGTLFECDQADCQDAQPLQEMGPQRFTCTSSSCSALAYGFSPYHRLEIRFSDGKTRSSNIFETTQFQATYQVTIRQDDLLVEPKFKLNIFSPYTYLLLCAACLGMVIILVIAIVLIIRRNRSKK